MQTNDTLVQILVGVLGAGGLVSLVRAVLDWMAGRAQKTMEVEDRYTTRLDRRLAYLEKQRAKDAAYEMELIVALARANLPIPSRRD